MQQMLPELTRLFDARPILGYLNFSDGRADPKFRKAVADVFGFLLAAGDPAPWRTTLDWLTARVAELEQSDSPAFRELGQAKTVLPLGFAAVPAAYRTHHIDLLGHQPDSLLFNAFFAARSCEIALAETSAGTPPDAIPQAVLAALNDYVGYRPIAVLESRPQTDFYPHEKVAPVPLFWKDTGVAPGRYADVMRPALELLRTTDANLLREASFDVDRMDELALDPRAADHFHPVSKRPSMLFGEWDPHRIDGAGYFRRFVLRQATLDALVAWAHGEDTPAKSPDSERLFEAAAVLAGTVLMGAGMSGAGPTAHDSTVTLANLVSRIARYRDDFYRRLLEGVKGVHGDRLRAEAAKRKQPFAGVRQFLNAAISSERAVHLQERRLGGFYAAMGYPAAARDRSRRINAPSVRLGTEIRTCQTEAGLAAEAGRTGPALAALARAEDLLRRGIDCGATVDPWNILGYQGLFPTFPGREDSVRDPRAEELILTIGRQFDAYARGLSAAAAGDQTDDQKRFRSGMRKLAEWWDKFATTTVSDLPKVNGAERAAAADHVARALALWRTSGAADPAFWRNHRDAFTTPSAYAQVIDALLDRPDYRAALGLLVTWLGDAGEVPLQDPSASFYRLAFRWLRGVTTGPAVAPADRPGLVRRYFELLEANADDLWEVPDLGNGSRKPPAERGGADDDEDDKPGSEYASAYEDVTYRDSAADGNEGSVADGGGPEPFGEFVLDADTDRTEERLRFQAAVARLWRMAARPDFWPTGDAAATAAVSEWLRTARSHLTALKSLAERLHQVTIPEPSGGVDGVIEFDRRRAVKGHLLDLASQTTVELAAAARSLAAVLARSAELPSASAKPAAKPAAKPVKPPAKSSVTPSDAAWEAVAVGLERAVAGGDAAAARKLLPGFVTVFRNEPLLVSPPADGGAPLPAIRAQTAMQILESLLARLPRLGLLRESHALIRLARTMERNSPPDGRRVSSFDQLFRTAVTSVVDAMLESAKSWAADTAEDSPLDDVLREVAESFNELWTEHSQSLRLSALEAVLEAADWDKLRKFVAGYGGDLFTVRFLTLSNVRGILAQGASAWLDREADRDDGEDPPKLVREWAAGQLNKPATVRQFETVLHALVEHYDEYRDYNTTTTQSDYGENLYTLLDFLRLKVRYDRYAWRLRPMNLTHELLCRRGFHRLAGKWREFIAGKTGKLADELLTDLTAREAEHGLRLRTIRDRLEERFVQPLRIDQAGSRVSWAAAAARDGLGEDNPAFLGLVTAVQPLADHPSGVGLDVPAWLRRLEDELRRFRSTDPDTDGDLAEQFPFPETKVLSFEAIRRQLRDWNKAIGE